MLLASGAEVLGRDAKAAEMADASRGLDHLLRLIDYSKGYICIPIIPLTECAYLT
jgi:hypothetical protein